MVESMNKYLVKLTSRNIASRWWGKQWCNNIGMYADYSNRLERGRQYIRQGAVEDIFIENGQIKTKVRGRMPLPYQVNISIDPASKKTKNSVLKRIKAIREIRDGFVPKDYKELFTIEKGLFPRFEEIHFTCSCPDTVKMCKHIAASLYAVGSVLDEEPIMLFKMRSIDVDQYLDKDLFDATNEMLLEVNGHEIDSRIIDDDLLSDIFGIDVITVGNKENKVENDEIRVIEIGKKRVKEKKKLTVREDNLLSEFVVRQYSMEGVFIREYSSIEEAEVITSIKKLNIHRSIQGTRNSAGGYQWKKEKRDSPIVNIDAVTLPNVSKPFQEIDCFDDKGNKIAHYESISMASRNVGVSSKSIRDAAKGIQKHAGGYVWRYSD